MPETLTRTQINPNVLAHHNEVIRGMELFVEDKLSKLVPPRGEYWVPSQYLPDIGSEGWEDRIRSFRDQECGVSNALLVCVIAHGVTEENLPSYLSRLQMFDGFRDRSGVDETPWAQGSREWTSQEYPHGRGIMKYLELTGRVNMVAVERTNQNTIRNGFDIGVVDPYQFFIYTRDQEAKTKLAHARTALLAKKQGAVTLPRLLGKVTGDESRHENYYSDIDVEIARLDPEGFVVAAYELFKDTKRPPLMPTTSIDDGTTPHTRRRPMLFLHYGKVAQQLGIFTLQDNANELGNLIDRTNIKNMHLSGEAAEAQEKLLEVHERYIQIGKLSLEGVNPDGVVDLSRFKPWLDLVA